MKVIETFRGPWVAFGLCLALLFSLGAGEAEAKKNKAGKCQGTKKQRKQKMDDRIISDGQFQQMIEKYKEDVAGDLEQMKQTMVRRLEREYEAHRATGEPSVYDFLVISGGGAKGAFGSGFFEGWGTIESGPFARPEFDMVTGVSTGSLLAPFVFLGTDEAYAAAVDFYANPGENWVKKRGSMPYLPKHVSMINNCHLQDTIRNAMDSSMMEVLAEAGAEDRLALIGTTNLDLGVGRAFNLGREAARAIQDDGSSDRVASILLASSAIPGVFPPIEIDGMLYTDGGATSNLFIATFPGPDGAVARFRASKPKAPLPKVRVWIVVNQQLKPQHAVTKPKWIAISGRALGTLTSTSQLFALALIRDMVHEARVRRGLDVELHLVSIPDDAPKKKTNEMFDKQYMLELQDLGRKMGADSSSWTESIPSAYRVEADWMKEL